MCKATAKSALWLFPTAKTAWKNIISKLPGSPRRRNPPTDDQKTSILEAKLQYEAMPAKRKESCLETAKRIACDAIAQLPQVKTAVEGTLTVAEIKNLLLEKHDLRRWEKLTGTAA